MVSLNEQPFEGEPSDDPRWQMRERLQHIRKPRWVDYPAATAVLDMLYWLYDAPQTHRPPCRLLYSDTNNGKTFVCMKFARDINGSVDDRGELSRLPVLMVQAPPIPDVGALYDAILRRLNAPYLSTARADRKYDQVLRLLPKVGVRMIIIDEINHVLAGKVDQRSVYLNAVKALSNELKIPIVLIGTQDALRVFQTDQQLGNRFEPFPLPRWSFNRDYAAFLWSLCGGMKLKNESNFRSKQLVVRFHTMAEGLTGETYKLMTLAAEAAVSTGREMIDVELLDELPWVAPSERRRTSRLGLA